MVLWQTAPGDQSRRLEKMLWDEKLCEGRSRCCLAFNGRSAISEEVGRQRRDVSTMMEEDDGQRTLVPDKLGRRSYCNNDLRTEASRWVVPAAAAAAATAAAAALKMLRAGPGGGPEGQHLSPLVLNQTEQFAGLQVNYRSMTGSIDANVKPKAGGRLQTRRVKLGVAMTRQLLVQAKCQKQVSVSLQRQRAIGHGPDLFCRPSCCCPSSGCRASRTGACALHRSLSLVAPFSTSPGPLNHFGQQASPEAHPAHTLRPYYRDRVRRESSLRNFCRTNTHPTLPLNSIYIYIINLF